MSENSICKNVKREGDVTALAHAQEMARAIVQRESRGDGDMNNAMQRISQRYGVPYQTLWALKYRPPKDIFVSAYIQLKAAYQAECERQERLLRHEREITKAKGFIAEHLVAAADALAGTEEEQVK